MILVLQTIYFNSKQQFPFQSNPSLESNAFSHLSLHCWMGFSGMSIIIVLLIASTPLKLVPLVSLSLGGKKKVTWRKIRRIGKLFLYDNIPLSSELLDNQGNMSRCIVMVKKPGFVQPQLSSLLTYWVKHMPQDFLVDLCSSVLEMLETSTNIFGIWFPGYTQKSMSHHQRWLYKANRVQFEDTWCPNTSSCDTPLDHHHH